MEQEAPPLFRSKLIESFLDFMQSPYALIGLLQRFRRYFKDQAGIPGTGVTMSKIKQKIPKRILVLSLIFISLSPN